MIQNFEIGRTRRHVGTECELSFFLVEEGIQSNIRSISLENNSQQFSTGCTVQFFKSDVFHGHIYCISPLVHGHDIYSEIITRAAEDCSVKDNVCILGMHDPARTTYQFHEDLVWEVDRKVKKVFEGIKNWVCSIKSGCCKSTVKTCIV